MMRNSIRRLCIMIFACLVISAALTGCKPSKKKVQSSGYYKELNKKYKKVKKENEKLKKELAERDAPSENGQRASDYLAKIVRDRIISIEVGNADNMRGGELIQDEVLFSAATAIAKRADLTSRYTPEQVKEKYGPGYEYILYDEDNAVYEIMVYGGNYVVFTDLPNNVYYAYNAGALGDALIQYRNGYPYSRLLHRLADSVLIKDDKNCYENDSAVRAANYIRNMGREKSSRKKADKVWLEEYKKKNKKEDPQPSDYEPEGKAYTFYHHGNVMVMTLYDRFICIKDMDEKETWYMVEKEDIGELKKVFQVPGEETSADGKEGEESSGEEKKSHEKEIEEESDVF
ncbi:MAG: hypothetical protein IJI25_08100 [Eubacterium sp.]|nr:hypothetical protein [Eubacterium sp.]